MCATFDAVAAVHCRYGSVDEDDDGSSNYCALAVREAEVTSVGL